MMNVKSGSIVVAADGSSESDRAVQWAAEQAHLERRPLVVVTAVQQLVPVATPLGPTLDTPVEDLLDHGAAIAGDALALATRHRPGIAARTQPFAGDPRDVLVELSKDAHLMVLGSRGRGRISSKLFGSVSTAVSKHAACPVVICRPGTELAVKHGVVVGADGTAESLPVLEFAFRQASLHSRPLTVVHCFWDVLASVDSPRLVSDAEPELDATRILVSESIAGFRERYPEVHVTLQIARGHAADCLAAVADRHDLVVVGRHPVDSFLRRLTGSVSTAVTERSHTSIAVVPEEWAA